MENPPTDAGTVNLASKETGRVARGYLPLAEDGRNMRALAKTAIAVAFVSAIVWFGHHHSHLHSYSYAALYDAVW
jgi:hypothetical protein